MRVIVDIMSGDNAPGEILKGTVAAAAELNASFILVGNEEEINTLAAENGYDLRRFDIIHTDSVITMEDDPLSVVRAKKDSSMGLGLRLLSEGRGDVFVSAGNTGALFTGASLIVRRIRGVRRAAIGTLLPTAAPCLLLDSGANVTVSPEDLSEFAVMGSAYMHKVTGIEDPTVGLLNNGVEEHKGTPLQVEANALLAKVPDIHYVGNVEGNAAAFGACHVLVTDGFTGNVFLKSAEGIGKLLMHAVKDVFLKNAVTKLSALLVRRSLADLKRTFDPAEYGGAPFLGISKPVVKAHGSSDARAFKNAILAAASYAESDVIYEIATATERHRALLAEMQNEAERGAENADATAENKTEGQS